MTSAIHWKLTQHFTSTIAQQKQRRVQKEHGWVK